jgi:osmotically-inducible protein OsmY
MKTLEPLYALACILALTGALAGCATDRSSGGKMMDGKITADVQAVINRHSDLGPPNAVRVQTIDHVVYLSGEVSDGNMKQTAESIALHSPGVTRVVNNIAVAH